MIKAIIFDCFGVVLSDGFEDAYTRFGGDLVADDEFIHNLVYQVSSGRMESLSSGPRKPFCPAALSSVFSGERSGFMP